MVLPEVVGVVQWLGAWRWLIHSVDLWWIGSRSCHVTPYSAVVQ